MHADKEHDDRRIASIDSCRLITLDTHGDSSTGTIAVIENGSIEGFVIKRVYFIYDVPAGVSRGHHSHKSLDQIIVALHGSFDITVDDGCNKRTYHMSEPAEGLLVVSGIWRSIDNFSPGAVCMVLASDIYEEADYIRLYSEFLDTKC